MTDEKCKQILYNLRFVVEKEYYSDDVEEALDRAIKALEAQTCIEDYPTCTECEHYDSEKHYCPRFCQVIRDTLAEAQPYEDCISRKAVIELIGEDYGKWLPYAIMELPSVQPKKGKWIEDAENFYKAVNDKGGGVNENTPYFVDDIACSKCLSKFSVIDNETERWKYCPNCGAEMSGGGEDETDN